MCGPHFCSLKISEYVRQYAAQQGISEEEALAKKPAPDKHGSRFMDAHSSFLTSTREAELAQLSYQMLRCPSLHEAQAMAIPVIARWTAADQAFWVKEPRHLQISDPSIPIITHLLCPRNMAKLAEPLARYRMHNPLTALATRSPLIEARTFHDCFGSKELSQNPFYAEISIPMSSAQTLAVEVQGAAEGNEIIALGVGREKRGFNYKDRYWFSRMKWAVDPILRYLREQEAANRQIRVVSQGPQPQISPFTPRESEVFDWLQEGKRNKEIAIILACSESTVKKHIASILRKVGAETRTAAVNSARG